ncbi:hypothetical protein ACJX0J_030250, partial [Zea mays]
MPCCCLQVHLDRNLTAYVRQQIIIALAIKIRELGLKLGVSSIYFSFYLLYPLAKTMEVYIYILLLWTIYMNTSVVWPLQVKEVSNEVIKQHTFLLIYVALIFQALKSSLHFIIDTRPSITFFAKHLDDQALVEHAEKTHILGIIM